MIRINKKAILGITSILLILIVAPFTFGINDAGHRTVVQYPSGTLFVKFEPGVYFQWFGNTTVYNDVITFDFDDSENTQGATIDQMGINVRYQDGGMGTIYGIARFRLPSVEADMLEVHKEFRSNKGVGFKLLKAVTEGTMNHTAGLMTSEESYAEKRGTYNQQARHQLEMGKYKTFQKEITTTEAGYEHCLQSYSDLTPDQRKECRLVKKTKRDIPVVLTKDGIPLHETSDLKEYGIDVSGFEIVDWGYEKKTLDQIAAKREATMAIITAKANAERAKQDAITAEEQGKRNVTVAKYEKEVEKERAVVQAEKDKQVAVIAAEKLVEVAAQQKLEQEQLKLAAMEYEEKRKAEGRGDASYKSQLLEADGALQAKLDAMIQMNKDMAMALANRQVPGTVFYTGGMGIGPDGEQVGLGTDGDVRNVLATQLLKNVQALGVDLQPKK